MSDNINERMTLDYESVQLDIEGILEEIGRVRTDPIFSKTFGASSCQKVKNNELLIKKRMHDTFNLVVIGDFKRGKSTLINALLGDTIVPTAVSPETVTINKISYNETAKVEAILKNGRRVTLSFDELKRSKLEDITKQLPSEIDYIDIATNCELLKDLTVIDTPGIGDLMREFDAQVADYLVNADAVLYVVSSRSPLSFTEQSFLSASVIPQSFSRILLVVNMADTLETQENIAKIKELTYNRASVLSDNIDVYMVSALDELCRKKNLKRPEPELSDLLEHNFMEFESSLQKDIILKKDLIKSMRSIALTRQLLDDLSSRIHLLLSSLEAKRGKLEEYKDTYVNQNNDLLNLIDKHRASLSQEIKAMKAESKDWMIDFLQQVKAEVETTATKFETVDLEKYFQFYLMDTIKGALMACIQYHQRQIADRISAAAKDFAKEITQNEFGQINAQIADCITDISWTGVDSAVFVGELLVGMTGLTNYIGPLYLVGQAVAGAFRQKVMSKRQVDIVTPVLEEFNTLTNGVLSNLDTIYEQLVSSALLKLDELYQEQVELSKEAIEQANRIVMDEDTKVDQVVEYLNEILELAAQKKEIITKYI